MSKKIVVYILLPVLVIGGTIYVILNFTLFRPKSFLPEKQEDKESQIKIKDGVTAVFPDNSEEENRFLTSPYNEVLATDSAYLKSIEKVAKEGDEVKLTNCRASPFVLKVRENQFTIRNNDSSRQSIRFMDKSYQIEATGQVSIRVPSKPKVYAYGCKFIPISGFIYAP